MKIQDFDKEMNKFLRDITQYDSYEVKMKHINEVTLYDLMSEDLSVWVGQNKRFGFDLHIEGDDHEHAVEEEGIHPFAMESFADVCRRFLYSYDRACAQMTNEGE